MTAYRRKPQPGGGGKITAERYDPPLTRLKFERLAEVAKLADLGEVEEVIFDSGRRVLLAWWLCSYGENPARPEYVQVEAGEYLAYGHSLDGSLFATDDDNLAQFYDRVPEEG